VREQRLAQAGGAAELPLDPDVDAVEDTPHHRGPGVGPSERSRPRRWPRSDARVLAVVLAGGVGGGLARYGVTQAWPTPTGGFPWSTFVVNTAGSFALPLLLVVLADIWAPHRYVRPLLGTGFLGAFTTFSSVTATADQLAVHGHARTAAVYLTASVLAALGAASFGLLLGRAFGARRHGTTRGPRRR
jgi:CrcB protein